MRARAAAIVAVLSLLLAGCASRPGDEVLQPVADVGGGKQVTVLVATTRTPEAASLTRFTAGRSDALHYARYVISLPPGHKPSQIEWPKGKPDPRKDFTTVEATPLSEAEFGAEVAARAPSAKAANALVFVHGYNYNFQESLFRAAQVYGDAGLGGAQVLFAWPSEGSTFGYVSDRDSALYSRDGLTHVLGLVARGPKVRRMALFGHSMGGLLSMEALRQLRLTRQDATFRKLEGVVLAAPDIDADVFIKQLEVVGKLSPPLTLLVAKDDGALDISRTLAGGRMRVGLADIDDPRVQAAAKQYDVRVVDISEIASTGDLNHGRYAGFVSILPNLLGQFDGRDGQAAGAGAFLLKPDAPKALQSVAAANGAPRS